MEIQENKKSQQERTENEGQSWQQNQIKVAKNVLNARTFASAQ